MMFLMIKTEIFGIIGHAIIKKIICVSQTEFLFSTSYRYHMFNVTQSSLNGCKTIVNSRQNHLNYVYFELR